MTRERFPDFDVVFSDERRDAQVEETGADFLKIIDDTGVGGRSMGGNMADASVLADRRVRAAAPVVGSPEWTAPRANSPHRHPDRFFISRIRERCWGSTRSTWLSSFSSSIRSPVALASHCSRARLATARTSAARSPCCGRGSLAPVPRTEEGGGFSASECRDGRWWFSASECRDGARLSAS